MDLHGNFVVGVDAPVSRVYGPAKRLRMNGGRPLEQVSYPPVLVDPPAAFSPTWQG